MAITIRMITKLVEHLDMKLVAGENGLDREVTWTHMVDSDIISVFLQGQELVFTTGIDLNEDLSLFELVKDVYHEGASGIVINIGPYVKSIDQDIIDFANENDFPVFEVPWSVHMAEIMRIICFEITKQQQNRIEISAALSNAFLCPIQEDLYVPILMKKGYLPNNSYVVSIIYVKTENIEIEDNRRESIVSQLSGYIRWNYKNILTSVQDKYISLVFCNYSDIECDEISKNVFNKLCTWLYNEEKIIMTVGNYVYKLKDIHKSYETACQLNKLSYSECIQGEFVSDANKLVLYRNIGAYRILLSLKNKDSMKAYVDNTVRPLIEYDETHGTDLSGELMCYIRHDCSLQDTADALFIHRNTVNYKINKAADILNMDITKLSTRFEINLGFMVNEILKI